MRHCWADAFHTNVARPGERSTPWRKRRRVKRLAPISMLPPAERSAQSCAGTAKPMRVFEYSNYPVRVPGLQPSRYSVRCIASAKAPSPQPSRAELTTKSTSARDEAFGYGERRDGCSFGATRLRPNASSLTLSGR